MPNIIDILARALSLRQETALNSITPNRAGGIMYDTLLVLNQMQLEGGALLISKVYASVSAMEADTTPTSDLTGRALKPGQLVVIVTSDSSSSDMGSEYRFNGPGSWTYVGKVGGLPLDTVPTQSSTKGITSGGVYTSLSAMKAEGYKYMGIATPGSGGTAPGTPNQPVFYIAGPGSYPNFGSITVASGYLGFIKYSSGSWSVESVAVGKDYDAQISALDWQITQLQAEVDDLDGEINGTIKNIKDSTGFRAGDGARLTASGYFTSEGYIPVSNGDTVVWNPGAVASNRALILYDSNKSYLQGYQADAVSKTITIDNVSAAFIRATWAVSNKDNARLVVNNVVVWKPLEDMEGISDRLDKAESDIDGIKQQLFSELIIEKQTLSSAGLNSTNDEIEASSNNAAVYFFAVAAGRKARIVADETGGGRYRVGITAETPAVGVAVSQGRTYDGTTAEQVLLDFEATSDCYVVVGTSTAYKDRFHFAVEQMLSEKVNAIDTRVATLESAVDTPEESIAARFTQSRFANKANPNKCLSLLHFSDIHGGVDNLERIVAFMSKWTQYIDDTICTGDIVSDDFSDSFIFDDLTVEGSEDILLCIGNHDTAKYESGVGYDWYYYAGSQDAYNRYMQNAQSWGVTLPTGAGQDNYYPCYYYKDYTAKGVRLIVLDMMDWGNKVLNDVADADNPQYTWLSATLTSAKTAGLHVVIAEHFPFFTKPYSSHTKSAEVIDSDFSLPNRFPGYVSAIDNQIGGNALRTVDLLVEDFKTAGGVFVCYICGHTHFDSFDSMVGNGNKVVVIGTANYLKDTNTRRVQTDESIDLFNILAIDATNRIVKVFRIGGHLTPALQKIDTMHFVY